MEKAAFVVRSPDGEIIEVGPEVPVDREHVVAESHRLRRKYGRGVSIDASQIVSARERAASRDLLSA